MRRPNGPSAQKNQMLISRFFTPKISKSGSKSSPPPVLTSRAKRVSPPAPGTLSINPDTGQITDYPAKDKPNIRIKCVSPAQARSTLEDVPSEVGEKIEPNEKADLRTTCKRPRPTPTDDDPPGDVSDDVLAGVSDDDEPPVKRSRRANRTLRSSYAGDDDSDSAEVMSAQENDWAPSDASQESVDREDLEEPDEPEDAENSKSMPASQEPTNLTSYSRKSSAEENEVPRDARQQRRFHKKLWPLGRKGLGSRLEDGADEGKGAKGSKANAKNYTPLESQYVKLRKQHPDMLLVIECGYKYRLFDNDATIASKTLRIAAYFDRNFLTASFPTHRLSYHVNRLVQAGYKVGVVNQSETAALKKASSKSSGLFQRKLEAVYTRGTMIADGTLGQQGSRDAAKLATSTYIMAILEPRLKLESSGKALGQSKELSFAAVDTTTGKLVWGSFADDVLRSELVSRLAALEPVEILLNAKKSSQGTEEVTKAFAHSSGCRIERVLDTTFAQSEDLLSVNQTVTGKFNLSEEKKDGILRCVGALRQYLKTFGLDNFLTAKAENALSKSNHKMSLGSDVLQNFEVLSNSNDGSVNQSLFALLNRTKTAAGSRQMRQWVCHPLVSGKDIAARLDAVDYLKSKSDYQSSSGAETISNALSQLLSSMAKMPDLERAFLRISCLKCVPSELVAVVTAFEEIGGLIDGIKDMGNLSELPPLLQEMFHRTPRVGLVFNSKLLSCLNRPAALENRYHNVFETKFLKSERPSEDDVFFAFVGSLEKLVDANRTVAAKIEAMDALLRKLRKDYSISAKVWKKVAKEEYLLEVPMSQVSSIPRSWHMICQTKTVKRFRPPQAVKGYEEVQCARETRDGLSRQTWKAYLELFTTVASPLRVVIRTLVDLDCFSALASVADLPGYTKPTISLSEDEVAGIKAKKARHPLAETLQSCHRYVPNDVELSHVHGRIGLVVSGPNYGGKSSYARMTALLVILAQIGSYVPAEDMWLSPFDSIFARMGSLDAIGSGMSSLMVELAETSRILSAASSKSLVVIDELGRGTSTHDGTAIAYATLAYLVEQIKCVSLFITHYPAVAKLKALFPGRLDACYMDYRECPEVEKLKESESVGQVNSAGTKQIKITLLYKLTQGIASSSYGLNVAQIAGVPESVIAHAKEKALALEKKVEECKRYSSHGRLLDERNLQNAETLTNIIRTAPRSAGECTST